MSIFSNTQSAVYWTNPDSNFNFTNSGFYPQPLINPYNNNYNNMPSPLSVTSNTIGINGGINGLGYGGGIGFLGVPIWGNGFLGI